MKITKVYILFIIFFFSFSASVLSQDKLVDSLKNELILHREKDTSRVKILNALALYYHKKDIDKSLDYISESESISKSLDFKRGIAESYYLKGISELKRSNLDFAIEYFNSAIFMYEELEDIKGLANCYTKLGLIYAKKNDFNNAIVNYEKAVDLDEKVENMMRAAVSLKHIGYAYFDLGNYDKARIYFDKALVINLKNNYEKETSSCYNIIGSIYLKRANYPIALNFYNESLEISEKIKDTISISKVLNNIGLIYKNYEKYDKAIENYKKALAVQKQIGNRTYVAAALNNIGSVYMLKDENDNALSYYNEALDINRALDNKKNITRNLTNIGNIYLSQKKYKLSEAYYTEANVLALEIGYQIGICNTYRGLAASLMSQGQYDKALNNALKSKKLAQKLKLLSFERDINELLSDIYKNKKDYKKALLYHKEYKLLNDSIFNKENIEKMAQIENEYKYKRQIDSLNINELKLTKKVLTTSQDLEKSQRNLFIGVIAFLITALVLCGIIFFLKLRNEKAKTQNIAIEQKLLRSQMTPHFIFNSLSVLQGMILNKEDKKSVFYLSKFSKLLRITLENSRDKLVPLNQELKAVNNYLELQNLEDNTSYNYTILVDKSIDETLFKIPPMLIQPFIENAIEHAFESQKENRKIDIQITYANKELICTITDNGIGIDSQNGHKRKDKKSLATTITSERLKMLSKDFNIKGSVQIEDRKKYNEQGTIVTLVIPYKTATV